MQYERRSPWWLLAVLLTGLLGFQIYAFHWGVITPDTVFQYGQALTGHYDDWHPPVTAWLWGQLLWVQKGSAPFLVLNALLYWIGIGGLAEAFRRRGQQGAMWCIVLCGALPVPFGQIGAILKDALFASSCLAATGLIGFYRLTGRALPRWAVLSAGLLLILGCATRFNGLFAVVPLALLLLPDTLVSNWRRLTFSALVAVMLLMGSGFLINDIALHPHRSQPIFSLVNFDLGGIVAHGGGNAYPQLDPDIAAKATAQCYSASLYNSNNIAGCEWPEDSLRAYSQRSGVGPLRIWLRAIAAHPAAYLRHRAAHLNRNWRWLVPNVPEDAFYTMSEANKLGLAFTPNWSTEALWGGAVIMAQSPFGRPATWLAVALGLLLIAPSLPSRRFISGLAASALCYGGAYAVVSVASDMRYNLWTMLAAMLALVCAVAEAGHAKGPFQQNWILAPLLPLLVIAAELIWLVSGLPALV